MISAARAALAVLALVVCVLGQVYHYVSFASDLKLHAREAQKHEREAYERRIQSQTQDHTSELLAAKVDAMKATAKCTWAAHPGATLGREVEHAFKELAMEGMTFKHKGSVRFGHGVRYVEKLFDGEAAACSYQTFGADPAPGVKKVCTATDTERPYAGSLEAVQETCLALGRACKGVSCVDGDRTRCSVRTGTPFLAPAPATSYVKECTHMEDRMGAGLRGKYHIAGEPTIFVSIAAYRDVDVRYTLEHLFKNAVAPSRVFVGLVCQLADGDAPCLPEVDCQTNAGFCMSDQIRMRTFDASLSEGPCHARAIASALYRNEDFFMMIDAHSRFVSDWDEKIIHQLELCQEMSTKCVLSCYPQAVNVSDPMKPFPLNAPTLTLDEYTDVSHNCGSEFHDSAIIKNQRASTVPVSRYPRPQPYTGAGLLFGPGRMVVEAPFDPHLPFLWDGEEFLYTARLWTWGYDFFAPGVNIVYHYYMRKGAPSVWGNAAWAAADASRRQKKAQQRLQYILGAPKPGTTEAMVSSSTTDSEIVRELPRYGLGTARTIDEYWHYARVDIVNRQGDPTLDDHQGYFCKEYKRPSLEPYTL